MSRRTVRTMCPMNCHPTYCGMVVEIEDDRVVAIRGDRDNPDSCGFLCVRGRAAREIVDNPHRILRPRLRDHRAADAWRDALWDEALDRIAGAIHRAGPAATAVWAGHGVFVNGLGGPLSARFAHLAGTQWWHPAIVCWGLGGFGFSLTGVTEVNSMDDMASNAELILLWGANLASQPNTGPRLNAARRRGARVIAIDVRRTEAFGQADETFIVRPGTDAALALAMMHVIVAETLYDREFIERHTVGFEDLAGHARLHTPEWAEAETGVPAPRIRDLARTFAGSRRAMILVGGSSMLKSGTGWHASRAIGCLPALTGSIGCPGAGMGPRHSGPSHGAGLSSVVPPRPAEFATHEVVSEMSTIQEALEGRIEVLVLLGTNMVSSFADSARLERALGRMPLVAAFDLFMNETIRRCADVVLPGTSWLEETGFKTTNTHLYLMDQAIGARGDARPLWWVLDQLATRLGVMDFFPWESADGLLDAIFDHDATRHAKASELRDDQPYIPLAVSHVGHPDHRFATPSGRVEFVSETAASLGLPALPVYERPAENHRTSAAARSYPLVLTQGRAITHFHGFYDHGRALPALARADPEPRLWINPDDAAARGVGDRAPIRMRNDRGAVVVTAHVTDRVPAGVVWMHDGWEGMNRLTSGARTVPDAAASVFPAGAAAYEARVEVELDGASR
ncbi:MAG TPA: molybdopterin-dependent oxidoreductase [Candidatus Dormibacteraeota bacterium]|nr:molybdopterin-dependent oxidoreductase [Candidatus Dormibacteraeota bacterium]